MSFELPARFWSKTREEDRGYETPCLIWTRATQKPGYGKFSWQGESVLAHRLAYEAVHGEIPDEIDGQRAVIDHRCRVHPCVNVGHLEVVTNGANVLRGETVVAANASKTHCSNGHEFTPENTARNSRGNRTCVTCVNANHEAWNEERRGGRPPSSTHCRNGHRFTAENTGRDSNGWRVCIACRDKRRARRARKH
ncbi:HNH endonuclease [Streptomyces sp. NBC_01717]|uniref:HNH endonuclease n=1 Tax=Streptomyces sp. NBC_01717 TaxID=2975918 RepID=UPI002E3082B1|nr:HNH endonuclease [Streptomyces sp. NBC_01717]